MRWYSAVAGSASPWTLLALLWSAKCVQAQQHQQQHHLRGELTQHIIPQNDSLTANPFQQNEKEAFVRQDDVLVESNLDASFNSSSSSSTESRRLSDHHTMFEPLECNRNRCSAGTTTWKRENYNPSAGKVTIPCGKCVTMNYDASDVLELTRGLNVEGTLIFPNGYKLTIKTPFVHVQGNLEMYARGKVTDEPNIRIILTGTNERITGFVPADNNRFACSSSGNTNPSPCLVGKKPIVVAGGKVTLRGVPNNCPTWTNLHDILRADIPTPTDFTKLPTPNSACASPLMQDDFSTKSNVHGWTGAYGALFDITPNGSFLVSDRKHDQQHGPTLDMRRIRDCLVPDQDYLFRARIRLTKSGVANGTPTTCAQRDVDCLFLSSTVRTASSRFLQRKMKLPEDQIYGWRYGDWHDFYAAISYSEDELRDDNIYQILQIRGPDPDVDIEMDDVVFTLPPPESVPNPTNVCGSNLISNGDAQLDSIHPYPFENIGGVLTVEEESDGNHYFHLYSRTRDSHTILYNLAAPGCLVANGKYTISLRSRVGSTSTVDLRIRLRGVRLDGSTHQSIVADCPSGNSITSWKVCEVSFPLSPELDGGGLQSIRLQFETAGDLSDSDLDIDDVKFEISGGSVSSIIVPDVGVSSCWDTGAEILVTSHTLDYDAGQVRRLVSSPKPFGEGLVRLELDEAIVPATTLKESPDFAVEVALLSRNILFEGDTDDSNSLMGAHFIVMHTPDVVQLIEGVEYRNFGQQSVLGKYPIHFHICDNVEGSIVTKNSIRDSNQRCIVVHGTHDLKITENVAYNTHGHCFMTEDGGEIDNVFLGNLGASTHAIPKENLIDRALESDDQPSTFWCSNPQNEWIGNVAAGSRGNGFWFELLLSVRGETSKMPLSEGMNPRTLNLKQFRDNVAHSNTRHGLRTYPHGFLPSDEAVFYNTRSFRNEQDGVFFHNSRNLAVEGGVLADNRKQFDFDRGAENVRLQGTSLIGMTDQYKNIVNTQPAASSHSSCVGIELHGFALSMNRGGATIRDIEFSGFTDTLADHTALFEIDSESSHGHFDYWTTLEGITVTGDVSDEQFDFRDALANGIDNIYITDIGSGMAPKSIAATEVSTVISNTPAMTQFVDMGNCKSFPERSYMYCADTCLRSAQFAVPSSMTDDLVLRVNQQGNPSSFVEINGKFDFEIEDGEADRDANTDIRKRRYFPVALPPARYVLRFIRNGQLDWPTSVEMTVEERQCSTPLRRNWIQLVEPDPDTSTCHELIKNGDMEMPEPDFPYWLHLSSGTQLVSGQGISGSTALSDTNEQAPSTGLIGQYVDTRCLERGKQFEVQAWVKLFRNDSPFDCDSRSACPKARIRLWTARDPDGLDFSEFTIDIVNYFERPFVANGWNLLRGTFTVDERIEAASSVLFFVQRGRTGIKILLDNVSISPVESQCNEMVFNGDFSEGRSSHWYNRHDSPTMVMDGNALKMTDRNSLSHSPQQDIRTGCLVPGNRYTVKARVRLENSNGSLYSCEPTRTSGNVCPRMRLRSFVDGGRSSLHDSGNIAITDHGTTSNGWYTMSGVFAANDFDGSAYKSTLFFENVSTQKDFVIDDVSIAPLPMNCNELFLNGDAEDGETPRFWTHWLNNGGTQITLVPAGSNNRAMKVHGRDRSEDGIQQFVDSRCLSVGSAWKVVARMKLVSKTTGQGVTCDPSLNSVREGCPPIRIAGWKSGGREPDQVYLMTNRPNWSVNDYNDYEVEFNVDSVLASCDRVSIGIRAYNMDWDMFIDDLSLQPM